MKHPMLFSPIHIGPHSLSHRVVMAPLTRMRSEPGDRPGALMAEYYSQRATQGGLIISEATVVSETGNGYLGVLLAKRLTRIRPAPPEKTPPS